jgi:UDP-N-acetylmuramyl pentapeptide synthase
MNNGGPEKLKFEENVHEPQKRKYGADCGSRYERESDQLETAFRASAKDVYVVVACILGRDVSGIVRAVGANVKHFKAGDQLVRLATNVEKGQVVLITGALGERLCTRRRR